MELEEDILYSQLLPSAYFQENFRRISSLSELETSEEISLMRTWAEVNESICRVTYFDESISLSHEASWGVRGDVSTPRTMKTVCL